MNLIVITTHKRDLELVVCLQRILKQTKDCYFLIFQDGKGDYHNAMKLIKDYRHKWFEWENAHGKENFYKVHHEIYKELKNIDFEIVHFIQDDCIVVDDYFDTIEKVFENKEVEVLNTLTLNCHLRKFAGNKPKFSYNDFDLYVLQKLDCNYVARRSFFEKLEWRQIPISSNYDFRNGSGVGSHTTLRYLYADGVVYNVLPSLLEHIGFDSKIGNKINYESVKSVLKKEHLPFTKKEKLGYKYNWL